MSEMKQCCTVVNYVIVFNHVFCEIITVK